MNEQRSGQLVFIEKVRKCVLEVRGEQNLMEEGGLVGVVEK